MDAMAAPARRTSTAVKKTLPEQIIESPEGFDLDQLIYIIESIRTNITPLGEGENVTKEAVRIRSNLTMHQQGTEVSHIVVANTSSKLPEVYINTLSLAGVNGPLATPFTELLLDSLKDKDFSGVHFLDIFHHRLASLWHRLRKRTYPHLYKSPPASTPIGMLQQDLSGFKQQGEVAHTLFYDHFWRRSRSISGLLQMVEMIFSVKAKATTHEGAWRTISDADGSKIGAHGQFQVLGKNAILGLRCWEQSAGFSITILPLDWPALQQFLPFTDPKFGGANFAKLKQLLISYTGSQPRVFLSLSLNPNENKGTILNRTSALGWNSWLTGNKADPLRLQLN
jgi:type VI secretion system protein ImpH